MPCCHWRMYAYACMYGKTYVGLRKQLCIPYCYVCMYGISYAHTQQHMYTWTRVYHIHTHHPHAWIHTSWFSHDIHTYMNTCIYTSKAWALYMHFTGKYTHTHMHVYIYIYIHTHIHAYTPPKPGHYICISLVNTRTHIYMYIYIYIYTHTHTYMHTHLQSLGIIYAFHW